MEDTEKDLLEHAKGDLPYGVSKGDKDATEPSTDQVAEDPQLEDTTEEAFDQDLVEAFLEMEDGLELGTYISEFDKARFKEIGYVLYQAFKQRNSYQEVKAFFKTDSENPLDFDEAVQKVTDLLLITARFKKLSKYVRVQLLYGLDLVKKNQEAPTISKETEDFINDKWKYLKTDCIRQFSDITGLHLTTEMVKALIKSYEKTNKIIDAMELVQEFELFDTDIDWEKGIKTLIDTEQWTKLMDTLDHKKEFVKFAIDLMSNNKLAKNAASIIDKMGLDIQDYPLVSERLQKKTIRYYVFNFLKGPNHHDFMPLWKIEDMFSGYNSMLAYICEDLAFKKEEKMDKFSKALAIRNGIFDQLRTDVQEKLRDVEVTEEDMKIDTVPDKFGPLSEPESEYVRLPSDTNVTFIGSEEEIKLAEPLLHSKCLGVDCEWRPSLVKFNTTGVALLQIGDKKDIFLIDMKALKESQILDDLLCKVFENTETDIIGMSFHNDLSELGRGCPNLKFFKKIENLYDVQPIYASLYKQHDGCGLSKIVEAVIGKKVCKYEQMANWERRPLRESQKHYAALDAYILVELFERLQQKALDDEVNITDYKNSYVAGKTQLKTGNAGNVNFDLHNQNIGKATVKTIKLKQGQALAVNPSLAHCEKPIVHKFCVDHNLSRLNKLFVHMGFESIKITKKANALERGRCTLYS